MSAGRRVVAAVGRARSRWRQVKRRIEAPEIRTWHAPPAEVTVSVIVPVKNAGADLGPLLARMREQRGFRAVEVVVVDSGSTDGSDTVALAHGATLVRIAPEEFSHSYARNLGAERAAGDYLLFTVQDALPPSDTWLADMYAALRRHAAAAVTCGEQPRADADLFYRVISWYHHRFMTGGGGDTVMTRPLDDSALGRRRNAQLSDTACLIGRDLFLKYRHRGKYAEDLDLGLRLSDDGHRLAFLAGTRIVHSHDRPAYYHLKRSYVEHLVLYDMLPGYPMAPAEGVTEDVASSFAAVDELVHHGLQALALPCSTDTLRTAVAEALRPAQLAAGPPARSGEYVDARTRAFVERLLAKAEAISPPPDSYLVHAMRPVASMICDYLEDSGLRSVDAELLEEIKAALYKGWALQCGVRLASAWWAGQQGVRETLRGFHEELTSGV